MRSLYLGLTECGENAAFSELCFSLAHVLEDAIFANLIGSVLEKKDIALVGLQYFVLAAERLALTHRAAQIAQLPGCLGQRAVRALAIVCAFAAVSSTLQLCICALRIALLMIVLQHAPQIAVVAAIGGLECGVGHELVGRLLEQCRSLLVRCLLAVEYALQRLRILYKCTLPAPL